MQEVWDLMHLINESDEIIGNVFRTTDRLDPRSRHLLYGPLLKQPGFTSVGLDSNAIPNEIARVHPDHWEDLLQKIDVDFHKLLQRFNPTYTVASYWSPIDSRRRSVVHCQNFETDRRREVIANALAFYLLTFSGASCGLFTLIHYISTKAPQKHGITTCFLETTPPQESTAWLHISPAVHGLVDELGISELIQKRLVNSSDYTSEKLDAALSKILLNGDAAGDEHTLASFVSDAIESFEKRLIGLKAESRILIKKQQRILQDFFGDEDIDFTKTAFMMATQLLWRRACCSQLMYAFPTYVSSTCCVLTMGTNRELSTLDLLAASNVARSLFVHPLLLDYGINEANREAERQNNVFRRFLGHNLPKIIISPVTVELENIKCALEDDSQPKIEDAIHAANRLQALVEHYENLLVAFMPGHREGFFTGPVEQFEFGDDVWPKVEIAFELMKSRILHAGLRKKLQLRSKIPSPCVIAGHSAFLTEILFNLIGNAVDSVSPVKFEHDPSRGVIEVAVSCPTPDDSSHFVQIRICDRGEGFLPEDLEQRLAVFQRLKDATREEFWSVVDTLLGLGVEQSAREEHMGMGLVLCAAYLRSLEWQAEINRQGRLELASTNGEGSTISIFLPC